MSHETAFRVQDGAVEARVPPPHKVGRKRSGPEALGGCESLKQTCVYLLPASAAG